MSKRRRHKYHPNKRQQQQPKQQPNRQKPNKAYSYRYIIPLAEWKRFERFRDHLPQIQEAISDLQENWNFHANFLTEELQEIPSDFEELHDTIMRVCDLINGVELPTHKTRRQPFHEPNKQYDSSSNYVSYRPKRKYDNMVAEILIEDISDGKL